MTQKLRYAVQVIGFLLISAALISGCGGGSSTAPPAATGDNAKTAAINSGDSKTVSEPGQQQAKSGRSDDLDDLNDDASSGVQTKASASKKTAHAALSTAGKPTGDTTPGMCVQQQNEFLGLTTVKLSKYGVRMDSPNITVIIPVGKDAQAYNSQNGACMPLTARSAAFMAGAGNGPARGELKVKAMGSEVVCGKKCIHYRMTKDFKDKKTKEVVDGWNEDVWATKDIGVPIPEAVIKQCTKITMLPDNIGFPVRIVRFGKRRADPAAEKNGQVSKKNKQAQSDVIASLSFNPAKLDKGEFVPLTGFTPVKDEMQFMMSSDDTDLAGSDLDDIADKKPVR